MRMYTYVYMCICVHLWTDRWGKCFNMFDQFDEVMSVFFMYLLAMTKYGFSENVKFFYSLLPFHSIIY